jgi:hypothetical protein
MMESQGSGAPNELREQCESLRFAEAAAAKHARLPSWYWISIALLVALEVFAVSWGVIIAISLTAVAMLIIGQVLTSLVGHVHGIRLGRVFGGAGSWLALPWFLALVLVSVCGAILVHNLDSLWPALAAAVLALLATLLFGSGFDRLRLHTGT